CLEKSSEALRGRTRTGYLLVGAVVRRVAGIHPASGGLGAGCPREDMACCRRLEATRPHRDGRSSEESWLPTETSPALLASSPRLIFSAPIAGDRCARARPSPYRANGPSRASSSAGTPRRAAADGDSRAEQRARDVDQPRPQVLAEALRLRIAARRRRDPVAEEAVHDEVEAPEVRERMAVDRQAGRFGY